MATFNKFGLILGVLFYGNIHAMTILAMLYFRELTLLVNNSRNITLQKSMVSCCTIMTRCELVMCNTTYLGEDIPAELEGHHALLIGLKGKNRSLHGY